MSFIDFLTSSFIIGTALFALLILMVWSIKDEIRRSREHRAYQARLMRMRSEHLTMTEAFAVACNRKQGGL